MSKEQLPAALLERGAHSRLPPKVLLGSTMVDTSSTLHLVNLNAHTASANNCGTSGTSEGFGNHSG